MTKQSVTTVNNLKVILATWFLFLSLGLEGKVYAETRLISSVIFPLSFGLEGKVYAETRLISSTENQPRVDLKLTVYRRLSVESQTSETELEWQLLASEARVLPGDILRYQLAGKNNGSRPIDSLVLTQPIPSEMTYILNSAKGGSNITFSIDNGVTFTANPTITNVDENGQLVKSAAPPESYTHVRWNCGFLAPGAEFIGSFEVKVK